MLAQQRPKSILLSIKITWLYYLLTFEERVCGKFKLSNCYLQIDDEGKVTEEITDQMRKTVHVPTLTWKDWDPGGLLVEWFSTLREFKTLIVTLLLWGTCLILPCLAPLDIHSVYSLTEITVKRKMSDLPMMLQRKYKFLNL